MRFLKGEKSFDGEISKDIPITNLELVQAFFRQVKGKIIKPNFQDMMQEIYPKQMIMGYKFYTNARDCDIEKIVMKLGEVDCKIFIGDKTIDSEGKYLPGYKAILIWK